MSKLEPELAATVTIVDGVIAVVVAVNVPVVLPPGIVAQRQTGSVTGDGPAGTTPVMLKETNTPPDGAGWLIVTVPVDWVPPMTVAGMKLTRSTGGGSTVSITVAVTVTGVAVPTAPATTMNDWMLVFGAKLTLGGTWNTPWLVLVRLTVAPPVGALVFRVTVPVTIWPDAAFKGLRLKVSEETAGGLIVRVPDLLLPLSVAEIVAIVWVATGVETIANEVLEVPAGTVTVVGTDALPLVLERVTWVPPVGAVPPSVTVPVAPWPPATALGDTVRALTCSGVTVKLAVTGLFRVAVIVTVVGDVTPAVTTENAPVIWPAANEMLDEANVATLGLLLESVTTAGPVGARLSVIVPATVDPPSTLAGGPMVMDCTCAAVRGSTFNAAETVAVRVAEMFTVVCVAGAKVLIMKVADVWPAGITTVGLGSDAVCEVSLESATVAPLEGAAAEIITVPVDVCPPSTSAGESITPVTLGGGAGGTLEPIPAPPIPGPPEQAKLAAQKATTSAPWKNWRTCLIFGLRPGSLVRASSLEFPPTGNVCTLNTFRLVTRAPG
jgi:hypothetical protein